MEDLFRAYWWLLVPLAWFVYAGFTSWLNYRRQRDAIGIIKSYADAGREPPEQVLKMLSQPLDSSGMTGEDAASGPRTPTNYWSLFGLFGVLAAGFGYAWWADVAGAGFAFGIVALTMSAVAVWSLINAAMSRPRR